MKFVLLLKNAILQMGLFDAPVQVAPHVKKDGTVVKPYTATRKKRQKKAPAPEPKAKPPEEKRRELKPDDVVTWTTKKNGRTFEITGRVMGDQDGDTIMVTVTDRPKGSAYKVGTSVRLPMKDLTLVRQRDIERERSLEVEAIRLSPRLQRVAQDAAQYESAQAWRDAHSDDKSFFAEINQQDSYFPTGPNITDRFFGAAKTWQGDAAKVDNTPDQDGPEVDNLGQSDQPLGLDTIKPFGVPAGTSSPSVPSPRRALLPTATFLRLITRSWSATRCGSFVDLPTATRSS